MVAPMRVGAPFPPVTGPVTVGTLTVDAGLLAAISKGDEHRTRTTARRRFTHGERTVEHDRVGRGTGGEQWISIVTRPSRY
jgi:hypothetical protein